MPRTPGVLVYGTRRADSPLSRNFLCFPYPKLLTKMIPKQRAQSFLVFVLSVYFYRPHPPWVLPCSGNPE